MKPKSPACTFIPCLCLTFFTLGFLTHHYYHYLLPIARIIFLTSSFLSGALFTENERDGPTELAFKYAVYRINKDRALLPNATIVYDIQYIPKDDSFHAAKRGELTGHSVSADSVIQ